MGADHPPTIPSQLMGYDEPKQAADEDASSGQTLRKLVWVGLIAAVAVVLWKLLKH